MQPTFMYPMSVVDHASNYTVVTNLIINFGFVILSHESLNFYPIKTRELSLLSLPFDQYLVNFLMGRNLSIYEKHQASFLLGKHPTYHACYSLPLNPRFETTGQRAHMIYSPLPVSFLTTSSIVTSYSYLHAQRGSLFQGLFLLENTPSLVECDVLISPSF